MQQKIPAGNPNQPPDRPVLLDAIDITVRAIEGRARLYRNLVVAVSAVLVLSILLSVLFRHWLALTGLVLLVPLTGGFLFFDSRLLRRWRARIVDMASLRGLDSTTFLKTISGFRHLPPGALKAMLATIPPSREEERQESPHLKQSIVGDNFDTLERKNESKILCFTGIFTLALVCLIAGAFCGSIALLASGGTLVVLLMSYRKR